jgi:hypothetical protein
MLRVHLAGARKCSAAMLLQLAAVAWYRVQALALRVVLDGSCSLHGVLVGGSAVARVSGSFGAAVYVCGCCFFAQDLPFLSFELQP